MAVAVGVAVTVAVAVVVVKRRERPLERPDEVREDANARLATFDKLDWR